MLVLISWLKRKIFSYSALFPCRVLYSHVFLHFPFFYQNYYCFKNVVLHEPKIGPPKKKKKTRKIPPLKKNNKGVKKNL